MQEYFSLVDLLDGKIDNLFHETLMENRVFENLEIFNLIELLSSLNHSVKIMNYEARTLNSCYSYMHRKLVLETVILVCLFLSLHNSIVRLKLCHDTWYVAFSKVRNRCHQHRKTSFSIAQQCNQAEKFTQNVD